MQNSLELIPILVATVVLSLCTISLVLILRDMTKKSKGEVNLRKIEQLLDNLGVDKLKIHKNRMKDQFILSAALTNGKQMQTTWENPAEFDIALDNLLSVI